MTKLDFCCHGHVFIIQSVRNQARNAQEILKIVAYQMIYLPQSNCVDKLQSLLWERSISCKADFIGDIVLQLWYL